METGRLLWGKIMIDGKGRNIDYMRISITDRCNLRCKYCMPDGIKQVSMSEILTYEEIEQICQITAKLGISKIKITGGEPLVRKGCTGLIGNLKKIPGIAQVTLTTNGVLLEEHLPELKQAGVDGINISLDTRNPERYKKITGTDACDKVLRAIDASVESKIPTKVNVVLQGQEPETEETTQEWKNLADLAKKKPLDVRFIELMPIGKGKERCGVSNVEILEQIRQSYPDMEKDKKRHGNGPAVYYQIPGFTGGIGFISAIHGKFCQNCNRIRLTSTGDLKPCMCYGNVYPIRDVLRAGNYGLVEKQIKEAIKKKPEAHCFEEPGEITELHQMAQIGG